MDEEKGGWCLGLVIIFIVTVTVCVFLFFVPREPLLKIHVAQVRPTATPNVFHQILLEEARTDNQIEVMTVRHELRKDWAWVAAPLVIIILGGACFWKAWGKWLSS